MASPQPSHKLTREWRQDSSEFDQSSSQIAPPQPAPVPTLSHPQQNGDVGADAALVAQQQLAVQHDTWAQTLVAASMMPFLVLLLPQILKNAVALRSGQASALGALSYWSFMSGMTGNSLLLSYFTASGEHSAVLIQALGVASSLVVLTQLLLAGVMPRALYAGVALATGLQAIMVGLKLSGALDASKAGAAAWRAWQATASLAGLILVPQALWAALAPGGASAAPAVAALVAAAAVGLVARLGLLPAGALDSLWSKLSGWAATLLFMLQPVAQLHKNFADPSSLAALSLTTVALATTGNALMLPRALFTRDVVWLTGSTWGCLVFGWAQMLSLALGTNPASGAAYMSAPLFALATAMLWVYLAMVLRFDARAKGLAGPWWSASLANLWASRRQKPSLADAAA